MWRRGAVALLILALLAGAPVGSAQDDADAPPDRQVLAYYVPYDPTSWASLQAHPDLIDIVGAQWVTINACGHIGSRDDQTLKQFAHLHGIDVYPSLLTLSPWLNHQLLTEPDVASTAIAQIVEYVLAENYAGFDLDLESIDPADRDAFTSFVHTLADALHAHGRQLSLAIPPKERDTTTGWAGAYDYAALGTHADLITIMTYEYRGAWSGPGSVAPFASVERALAFATRQIPPHKVRLGIAHYGYDWNTTSGSARALGFAQAIELAERYAAEVSVDPVARSATFRYEAPFGDPPPAGTRLAPLRHTTTVRTPPACDVVPPPAPAPTPRPPDPPPDAMQEHEVWFEESVGARERLELAARYGAGGVATWRLGQEDPEVWTALAEWRAASAGGR